MAIRLHIQENRVRLNVGGDLVRLKVSEGRPVYPEAYAGATEVTPTEQTQTLATEGYYLASDITVLPIPYPNGNDLAYGIASCEVGTAKVGTAYVWTDYVGEIAIINKAVVGTSVTV